MAVRARVAVVVEGQVLKAVARVGATSAEAVAEVVAEAEAGAEVGGKHYKWRHTGVQQRRANNGRELPSTRKIGRSWSDPRNSKRTHGQTAAVAAVAVVAAVAAAVVPTSNWRRPCCRLRRRRIV